MKVNNWHHGNAKDCKRLFQATMSQQNGQSGRIRKVCSLKTEPGRKKIWTDQLPVLKFESVTLNLPQQTKVTHEFYQTLEKR